MSGTFCTARGCSNRRKKGKSFHRFPRDEERRRQWVLALKREGFQATEYSRICGDHFEKQCYNPSGLLKHTAVPTIFNFPDHLQKGMKPRKNPAPRNLTTESLMSKSSSPSSSSSSKPETGAPETSGVIHRGQVEHSYCIPYSFVDSVFKNGNMNATPCVNLDKDKSTGHEKRDSDHNIMQVIDMTVKSESNNSNSDNTGLCEDLDTGTFSDCGKRFCQIEGGLFNEDDLGAVKTHTVSCNALITTDENVGPKFECSQCGVNFNQREDFILHMRKHSSSNLSDSSRSSFICGECGKTFNHSGHVYRHMRTHTGEKPFECSECGKSFCRSDEIRVHMQIHEKEKDDAFRAHEGEKHLLYFKCSQCSMKFNQREDFILHIRKHSNFSNSNRSSFICGECGKTFNHSGQLYRHMRTHTGEKPFECIECSKRFCRSDDLRVHMRTHMRKVFKHFGVFKKTEI